MRPLAIEFQAFGSYPGTVSIDFTALARRGLFVVCGDTGTGKTTIFDAMCFALYGDMPLKDGRDVRSHHADPATPTSVTFTFECDGDVYVVHRTPEQERPAKRGGRTTVEKAAATVVRRRADGDEPLATKPSDAVRICTDLVGLEVDQFQRVVLLPQGEFSKFLLAGSIEREKLLGQLFGGRVYDDLVDVLKRVRDELHSQVGQVDSDIRHQLDNGRIQAARLLAELEVDEVPTDGEPVQIDQLDRDGLLRLVESLGPALRRFDEEVRVLRQDADQARQTLVELTAAARRFDDAVAQHTVLDRLASEAEAVGADEEAALRSRRFRPAVDAAGAAERARIRLAELEAARDRQVAEVTAQFAAIGVTVESTSGVVASAALGDARADHLRAVDALERFASAAVAVDRAAELVTRTQTERQHVADELDRVTARLQEVDAVLPDLVERARPIDDLPVLIERAVAALADQERAVQTAADLVAAGEVAAEAGRQAAAAFERFVATQAPRLASDLRPGEPCTVCGSTDHPRPATDDGGAPTGFDVVEAAQRRRDEAEATRNRVARELEQLRGRLGDDADRPIDELRSRLVALRHDLAVAEGAAAELARLRSDQEGAAQRHGELARAAAGLEATMTGAQAELERCRAERETAAVAVVGLDPDEVARRGAVLDALAKAVADLDTHAAAVADAAGAARAADDAAREALERSGVTDLDVARSAVVDPTLEERSIDRAGAHRTAEIAARSALEVLEAAGVPAERPDVDDARLRADDLAARRITRDDAFARAAGADRDAREAIRRHDDLIAGSSGLRERFALATQAYKVCTDGGALRMPLRRWVLAHELDRVTDSANVHLQRMTAGRYVLRRRQEVLDGRRAFGLDLEVVDAHTGRARATTSLSGGEQFQASLALALGLADVVSHGGAASGKRFEALFVDEGFGSLDPAALQEAIGALRHLQAGGRMVGAITHVEAMKQDLHVGIEVRRLPDGRGSTLVVHA